MKRGPGAADHLGILGNNLHMDSCDDDKKEVLRGGEQTNMHV